MAASTITKDALTYVISDSTTYYVGYTTPYFPVATITETDGLSTTTTTNYGPDPTLTSIVVLHLTSPASQPGVPPSISVSSSSTTTSTLSTTSTFSAAASSSSIPVSPPTPSPQVKVVTKHQTGAIAGAAAGCLVGGALIAALITWFIMSHRQKKQRSTRGGFAGERQRSSHGNAEKSLPAVSVAAVGVTGNWEKHLDQPESDNTITRSVQGLFDHIEVHVENFYRDAKVIITPELQDQLMTVDSEHLPDSIVGLLPQTERPTMLIKHCIARSIVAHISSEIAIQDSFLPIDFIALPQVLAARRTTAEKPGKYLPPHIVLQY